jgi:hypothetical protein
MKFGIKVEKKLYIMDMAGLKELPLCIHGRRI